MDIENYKEGQYMQRPSLFEANGFIYCKNRFETYVKSKDIDLWHIIVDGDYKAVSRNSATGRDERFRGIQNPNHFISDCSKHSYNDQKAFVGGSWGDSNEEDLKKDKIFLMAHKSNEKLKERLKRQENNKALNVEFKPCLDLRTKNNSLASKLAKFESSHYLKEMLKNQRSPNDRKGLGFTDKASTSEVKLAKTIEKAEKGLSDVSSLADPFKRDSASTVEGIRAFNTTELKNVNKGIKDESWIIAMQ
ncbi:hypothetical protein Tco_0615660 [Tanacetum coccineum]